MAHLILLHQLDQGNTPGDNKYIPTLFNLDSVDLIEPSTPEATKTHSLIQFRWGSRVKVKESLTEIREKSLEH
jgi:hypothetical protein